MKPVKYLSPLVVAILLSALSAGWVQGGEKTEHKRAVELFNKAKRGWMGVKIKESKVMAEGDEREGNHRKGVEIVDVVEGSPAMEAELEKGDLITRIDYRRIESIEDLTGYIKEKKPGDTVRLVILRDGREKRIRLVLGEWPERTEGFLGDIFRVPRQGREDFLFALRGGKPRLGVTLIEPTDQLRDYFRVERGLGVLVSTVIEDTPAEKAGLKAGDVILAVNGDEIRSTSDLRKSLDRIEKGEVAEIDVMRAGSLLTFSAEIDTERSDAGYRGLLERFTGKDFQGELRRIDESKEKALEALKDYLEEHEKMVREQLEKQKPLIEDYLENLRDLLEHYRESLEGLQKEKSSIEFYRQSLPRESLEDLRREKSALELYRRSLPYGGAERRSSDL